MCIVKVLALRADIKALIIIIPNFLNLKDNGLVRIQLTLLIIMIGLFVWALHCFQYLRSYSYVIMMIASSKYANNRLLQFYLTGMICLSFKT